MDGTIQTRQATAAEEPCAQAVAAAAFEPLRRIYRPRPTTPVAASPRGRSRRRLVVVEGEAILGTVQYQFLDDRLHLLGLAVHPDHQRRGIARRLIDHLEPVARERGCRALSLDTIAQTGNVAVFQHLGFHVVRTAPDRAMLSATGQTLDEVYMERPLAR